MNSSLKLSKVILKNFGSYETETSIDLTASPLLICGDTGVGKSSIIEAIFACLTGGNIKDGVSLNEMISQFPNDSEQDRSKRELKAVLFFENNGVHYQSEISKTLKSSQKTILSVLENGLYNPKFTQQEAQKELELIVGVSAKALLSTNILKQGQGSIFNKLSKSEKKDMIFEFFSLNIFEQIQEKTNKDLREVEKELDILMRNNYTETEELNSLKMSDLDRKYSIDQIDAELKILQDNRYELENEKKVLDDINKRKSKIQDLNYRLSIYKSENESLNQLVIKDVKVSNIYQEIASLESEITNLQSVLLIQVRNKTTIEGKKNEISQIKENFSILTKNNNEEVSLLNTKLVGFIVKSSEELGTWTEEKTKTTINTLTLTRENTIGEIANLNKEIAVLIGTKDVLPRNLVEIERNIDSLRKKDAMNDVRYLAKKEDTLRFDIEAKRLQEAIRDLSHMCDGECPTCHQSITVSTRDITKSVLNERMNDIVVKREISISELNSVKSIIEKEIRSELLITEEGFLNEKKILLEGIDTSIATKKLAIQSLNESKVSSETTIEKLTNGLLKYFTELAFYDKVQSIVDKTNNIEIETNSKIVIIEKDILSLHNTLTNIDYEKDISSKKDALNDSRKLLVSVQTSDHANSTIAKNITFIDDIKKELSELSHFKEIINTDLLLSLEDRLLDVSTKISSKEGEIFSMRKESDRLVYLEGKMVNYITTSKKLSDEIDVLTEMTTLYSRDGIPTELIKEIAGDVEDEGNKYLSKFSGGRYSMKFVFEDEKSTGKGMKKEFDIKIFHENVARKYSQLSGGEQTWIDWAQHIAFAKVLYKKFNKPFIDLLIIDEGFGTQGNATLPKIVNALYVLQKEFSNILIISHHPALQEVFTNRVEIKKNEANGRSFID